jgi:hypothetical protein
MLLIVMNNLCNIGLENPPLAAEVEAAKRVLAQD